MLLFANAGATKLNMYKKSVFVKFIRN